MKFIQNNDDGACDIIFSDNEVEIIKNKKKVSFNCRNLKTLW